MIRGIQLKGDIVRSLRRSRGWSQLDLAERAGVGERTIRNAEMGRVIEGSTASYIAGALDVSLELLLKSHSSSPQFDIRYFEQAFRDAFLYGRTHPLQSILHPECRWRMIGLPHPKSFFFLETAQNLKEGFEAIRATTPWNQPRAWNMNREESAMLSDSFFIIATLTSADSSLKPIVFRTHILGRLHHEKCTSITQTWEAESVE